MDDEWLYPGYFVCRQNVHDDHLSGTQLWAQHLFQIGQEDIAIGGRRDGQPRRTPRDLHLRAGHRPQQRSHPRHERTTSIIPEFFAPVKCRERVFDSRQEFDFEGLAGRLLSSSYAPLEEHPNHAPMMNELEKIFRKYARDGKVAFEYKTRVYFGILG